MSYKIDHKCIGCGLCRRNCPVGAIDGEQKKQHIIDDKECVSCGVCGRVCPVGAVSDDNGVKCKMIKKTEWLKPKFDYEKCFGCRTCAEMCLENCIKMEIIKIDHKEKRMIERPILIDPENCISCRACESVCGISAVSF